MDEIQTKVTKELAMKDGLSYQDFVDWVEGCKDELQAVITW